MKSTMSPGKIVFGVVPSKDGNRCPRKSGFIFIILLFIVPASLSCSLSFVLVEMAALLGKSLSFFSLCVLLENV